MILYDSDLEKSIPGDKKENAKKINCQINIIGPCLEISLIQFGLRCRPVFT